VFGREWVVSRVYGEYGQFQTLTIHGTVLHQIGQFDLEPCQLGCYTHRMTKLRGLMITGVALSGWVLSASASTSVLVLPTIVPTTNSGSSSLVADPSVSPILDPVVAQGLTDDIGFSVTGPFTFDTSDSSALSPTPSVTYSVVEAINLNSRNYETSTHLVADISDSQGSAATGYLLDLQVVTQLFSDAGLTELVDGSFSSAGQTGFPGTGFGNSGTDPFCPLASCAQIGSGSTSGLFAVTAGTYYLEQTFTAAVTGVGQGDTITIDLPNTSGVGTPEPAFWGVLSVGLIALVFARRRVGRELRS
jgi:hypothetical protein